MTGTATCKSCGRSLSTGEAVGTDEKGQPAEDFCADCLRAGKLVDPPSDRPAAVTRMASYFERELNVPAGEARSRAAHMMLLSGGFLDGALLAARGAADTVVRHWWSFLLRGVLAVILGIFFIQMPAASLAALVLLFGFWAFVDGVMALFAAAGGWRSWQLLVIGLIGIAVGVLTFARPALTAVGLYFAVAAWSVARGIFEIAAAIELRRAIKNEGWLILGGLLSVAFGILLVVLPLAGVLAIAWLIGLYAITWGAALFGLAFHARSIGKAGKAREQAMAGRKPERPSLAGPGTAPQPT